jgi:hypothetical protein
MEVQKKTKTPKEHNDNKHNKSWDVDNEII